MRRCMEARGWPRIRDRTNDADGHRDHGRTTQLHCPVASTPDPRVIVSRSREHTNAAASSASGPALIWQPSISYWVRTRPILQLVAGDVIPTVSAQGAHVR